LACVGLWLLVSVAACGKKGPPLAPLNMAPVAPSTIVARRLGDTVYLQMTVPASGAVPKGPFSIDHIDVYAVTLAAGSLYPPNRDLLKPEHVVAKIAIAPPPDPEAADPETPEKRPHPGDIVTFVETLAPALLVPQEISKPLKPVKPPRPIKPPKPPKTPKTPPLTPPTAVSPAPVGPVIPPALTGPSVLTRMYVLLGVSAKKQQGTPSARIEVPLLAAPGAARAGPPATFDETSVTVNWNAPATTSDEASGVLYNVYAVPAAGSVPAGMPVSAPVPLNLKPLDVTTFAHDGAVAGKQQCFVVRSVAVVGATAPAVAVPAAAPTGAMIESEPSEPICVTPNDTFPPAPPKNLQAVGSAGVINLIWDANTESDLAGYLVLRGEAPGDTLQPLTPEPIRETRYQDRSTRPGVTYVYAIIAVDRATPPNKSASSNRVQETAR
jgi:hypothetical protein